MIRYNLDNNETLKNMLIQFQKPEINYNKNDDILLISISKQDKINIYKNILENIVPYLSKKKIKISNLYVNYIFFIFVNDNIDTNKFAKYTLNSHIEIKKNIFFPNKTQIKILNARSRAKIFNIGCSYEITINNNMKFSPKPLIKNNLERISLQSQLEYFVSGELNIKIGRAHV